MASRTFQKARLALFVALLLAWVGWLGTQAFTRGRFPVVSHSQLLVSTLDVVADVTARPDGKADPSVVVREVLWPQGKGDLVGTTIAVVNLPTATLPAEKSFQQAGRYVLPLVQQDGKYAVADLPPSPSFPDPKPPIHVIYPDTDITRRQLAEIPKP